MTLDMEEQTFNWPVRITPLPRKKYEYVAFPSNPRCNYKTHSWCTACERKYPKGIFYCPKCPVKRRLRQGPVKTKNMEFVRY